MRRLGIAAACAWVAITLTGCKPQPTPTRRPPKKQELRAVRQLVDEARGAIGDENKAHKLYGRICTRLAEKLPEDVFVQTWVALGKGAPPKTMSDFRVHLYSSGVRARAEYTITWEKHGTQFRNRHTAYLAREHDEWRLANVCAGMPSWWRRKSPDEAEILAAAQPFLYSWQRRDYAAMYAQLPQAGRKRKTADQFEARWQQGFYPVKVIDIMMPQVKDKVAVVTCLALAMRNKWKRPTLLTIALWAEKSEGRWWVSCERLTR